MAAVFPQTKREFRLPRSGHIVNWFAPYLEHLHSTHIFQGTDAHSFRSSHMDRNAEISAMLKRITEAEKLVADQVERIYMLKSKQADAQKAEVKLEVLCTNLAQHRVRFSQIISSIKTYRPPHKLLRETADVGGLRWRIGWGGIA